MFYALVYYPLIDVKPINSLRGKYDPQFDLIAPHITLIFPVQESIGEQCLIFHIKSILKRWKPFVIHLHGLYQSPDNYLFLILQEGNSEVINLYQELNRGILAPHRREYIQFIPHITLGFFAQNIRQAAHALATARQLELNYHCLLDKLHLLKINFEKQQINLCKEFYI